MLYRIKEKATGSVVGDFVIETSDATLLSSTHEFIIVDGQTNTLDELKAYYADEVNKKASEVRGRFLTLELGQETTYAKKANEALTYLQASTPIDTDYPYLYNEATATADTVGNLAQAVIDKVQAMDAENVIIEAQRKRGVKRVLEAVDEASAITERDIAFEALNAHVPT